MKQRYPNMRRFRDANYRRPLILIELLRYNADVICLQEVDEKAFTQYFEPHLKYAGGPPDAQSYYMSITLACLPQAYVK